MSSTERARPSALKRTITWTWKILGWVLAACFMIEVEARLCLSLFNWDANLSSGYKPAIEDVPYNLHPYLQMTCAPAADVDRGPDFAGWKIDPPEAAYDKSRKRILFLGGSTTANAYPNIVRAELEKSEAGAVTVYNISVNWHCSLHSLYKLWTYADTIQPDLVIVLENIGDFVRGFTGGLSSLSEYRSDYSHYAGGLTPWWAPGKARFDERPVFYARRRENYAGYSEAGEDGLASFVRVIVDNSSFLRLLRRHPIHLGAKESVSLQEVDMPPEVYLRALPDFERNMRALKLSCKGKGLRVLFLTMPFTTGSQRQFRLPGQFLTNDREHYLSSRCFELGLSRFNEAVQALKDEPDSFVLDLVPAFPDNTFFEDEVHLLADGQRREAEIVARYILDHGLLAQR